MGPTLQPTSLFLCLGLFAPQRQASGQQVSSQQETEVAMDRFDRKDHRAYQQQRLSRLTLALYRNCPITPDMCILRVLILVTTLIAACQAAQSQAAHKMELHWVHNVSGVIMFTIFTIDHEDASGPIELHIDNMASTDSSLTGRKTISSHKCEITPEQLAHLNARALAMCLDSQLVAADPDEQIIHDNQTIEYSLDMNIDCRDDPISIISQSYLRGNPAHELIAAINQLVPDAAHITPRVAEQQQSIDAKHEGVHTICIFELKKSNNVSTHYPFDHSSFTGDVIFGGDTEVHPDAQSGVSFTDSIQTALRAILASDFDTLANSEDNANMRWTIERYCFNMFICVEGTAYIDAIVNLHGTLAGYKGFGGKRLADLMMVPNPDYQATAADR